jgi:hypothetical protein
MPQNSGLELSKGSGAGGDAAVGEARVTLLESDQIAFQGIDLFWRSGIRRLWVHIKAIEKDDLLHL